MSDLCPTCFSELGIWLDDPILTPKGLSGVEYEGNTEVNVKHIRELQARCIEEEEINSVSPRTTFSAIGKNGKREITLQHINEIRQSIEKILRANIGILDEPSEEERKSFLYEYFNYDAEGNYMIPADEKYKDKNEWTDIDPENLPKLPTDKKIKIKAVHVEDLRHPLFLPTWVETFDKQEDIVKYPALSESGSRAGLWSWAFSTKYYNIQRIPIFYGNHKWGQGIGFIYPGDLLAATFNPNKDSAISYDLKQENSKLKYNFQTEIGTYGNGLQALYHSVQTSVRSYFSPLSKLSLQGITFNGDNCECLITIPITLYTKKLISLEPLEYGEETAVYFNLYFHKRLGYVEQWDVGGHGPAIRIVEEGGRLIMAYKWQLWANEEMKHHYPVEDKEIKVIDAINYQWGKDFRALGESKEIGKNYVSRIYIGDLGIYFIATAYSDYWPELKFYDANLDFSIDTIKFTRLFRGEA